MSKKVRKLLELKLLKQYQAAYLVLSTGKRIVGQTTH